MKQVAKGKPLAPLLIGVDHRERPSGVIEALRQFEDVQLEVAQLAVGDYMLGPEVLVERKTVADLVASIMDRRLFEQIQRLQEACQCPLFVLEGAEGDEDEIRIHPNAWRGALSYIQVLQRIPLLRTRDARDTAAFLHTAARHVQRGLGYQISLHRKPKASDPAAPQRYVLSALPGVGPALAEALLTHLGSLEAVFRADVQALRQVPGVGQVTAARIRGLLEGRYRPDHPDQEE